MEEPSNGRPALVRNTGIRHARGQFLYFLDDDDKAVPGGIDRLVTALQRHPRKGVAYGCVECFGPDSTIRDSYNCWFSWAAHASRRVKLSSWLTSGVILFRGTLIINSACMVRKDVAVRLGGHGFVANEIDPVRADVSHTGRPPQQVQRQSRAIQQRGAGS